VNLEKKKEDAYVILRNTEIISVLYLLNYSLFHYKDEKKVVE